MTKLNRMMRARSIAVIGGGMWCDNVINRCREIGFAGDIWPVHPTRAEVAGLPAVASVEKLPAAPDAAFVGVNSNATIDVVDGLSRLGAGGAVCFASGFREASAEVEGGSDLQDKLVENAGEMPLVGPNCYGFVNALDRIALWPDQHGLLPVERGVAIITQSSNIAMNVSMQRRGLPIAFLATTGNQAQVGLADLANALAHDPRITAIGLHVEGFGDVGALEEFADTARKLNKPVVVLKVGASQQAQAATISHTASLAGSDAGARALLRRLGLGQASSLSAFLEALKILHVAGPLTSNSLASLSCSGGEAALIADSALAHDLQFPPLTSAQQAALRRALGPKVALANPLDYHTYIWGNQPAFAQCFAAIQSENLGMACAIVDFPRSDRCSQREWKMVSDAVAEIAPNANIPMAVLASYSDTMPEDIAVDLVARGIVPLAGMAEGLEAISIAAQIGRARPSPQPVLKTAPIEARQTITEAEAKGMLAQYGLNIPQMRRAESAEAAAAAASALGFPVVLKGEGAAHKTEAGFVALGLTDAQQVKARAQAMAAGSYLVEQMVTGAVAELIVGVVRDAAHGFVLTIGAGGVLTEILKDTVSLILPASEDDIRQALENLRIAPLLAGYRGADAADMGAIVKAVLAIQACVVARQDTIAEIEVNPLLCTTQSAIAVDALIREGTPK